MSCSEINDARDAASARSYYWLSTGFKPRTCLHDRPPENPSITPRTEFGGIPSLLDQTLRIDENVMRPFFFFADVVDHFNADIKCFSQVQVLPNGGSDLGSWSFISNVYERITVKSVHGRRRRHLRA